MRETQSLINDTRKKEKEKRKKSHREAKREGGKNKKPSRLVAHTVTVAT